MSNAPPNALEIPGHPGYLITPHGDIYSASHNWHGLGVRLLSIAPNSDGYPSVRLSTNGGRHRYGVHVLMALTFLAPRPSPIHEVRHIDGIKAHCNLSNLAWGTCKENADDRERHGRTSRGESHSSRIREGLKRKGLVKNG